MKPVYQFHDCVTPSTALFRYAVVVLDGIEPSDHCESLETSLEIASISSPDLRKQITIVQETLCPDGKLTSFWMIMRVLGMARATVAEYYTCCLIQRCHDLRPTIQTHASYRRRAKI
jgi:hypothetical protein